MLDGCSYFPVYNVTAALMVPLKSKHSFLPHASWCPPLSSTNASMVTPPPLYRISSTAQHTNYLEWKSHQKASTVSNYLLNFIESLANKMASSKRSLNFVWDCVFERYQSKELLLINNDLIMQIVVDFVQRGFSMLS